MITIQCDNCEKTFEVDSAEAGGKVPCPFCADVNRVPVPAGRPPSAARSPVIASPAEQEKEKEIMRIRPAMFRAHPFRFALIVILFVGGLVLVITALASIIASWLAIVGIIPMLAGLIWWVGWWSQTTFWLKVIITNRRTIRHEGVIRRHITEVLHDHVRSVDIKQSFMQRIFNVGYIGVDSAGQDGVEIEIRDIPGPHRVKEIIDRYRKM